MLVHPLKPCWENSQWNGVWKTFGLLLTWENAVGAVEKGEKNRLKLRLDYLIFRQIQTKPRQIGNFIKDSEM